MILILVYYLYFTKKLNDCDSDKKKVLTLLSFIGSFLILIGGAIFLYLVISDDNIDTEIAFN